MGHFGPRLDLSSIKDIWGNTMLHTAAYAGRRGLVEFLLQHTVPVNAKNVFGQTPRALAEVAGHRDVSRLLAPGDEAIFKAPVPHNCREDIGKAHPSQPAWDLYCSSGWTSHEQASRVLNQFPSCSCQLPVVHAENMTSEQFSEVIASQHKPVLLHGLTTHWPAWKNWKKQLLLKRYAHSHFPILLPSLSLSFPLSLSLSLPVPPSLSLSLSPSLPICLPSSSSSSQSFISYLFID